MVSSPTPIDWAWKRRGEALPPQAALAWGEAAARLLQRLGRLPAEELQALSATANRDLLFVSGTADRLPWVEGVAYAAPCPDSPALWLPTQIEPDVPSELLARGLLKRYARQPLLLWHQPPAVVPLDRQLPLSEAHLQRIARFWRGPS